MEPMSSDASMERRIYRELERADEIRDLNSDYETAIEQSTIERIWQEQLGRGKRMVGKCAGCGAYGEMKRDKLAGLYLVMCYHCGSTGQGAKDMGEAIRLWNERQESIRASRCVNGL